MTASTKICTQCGREYDAAQKFCPEDGSVLRNAAGTGDLVGSVIADRYHVIKKLGEGGMGQVYLAEHVRMGRKSALKVMSPQMMSDPDAISRFNREAANACQINHPHIAAVYDFGETTDGLIFLAMEFVDGESLSSLIERHHALPAHRAAEITRQVGDALTAAHEIGIVHRDLKPDNIMITRSRDGADVVKVVDFGIAKASRGGDNQKVTRTGWIVGTPEYMSPEQLAGDPVDARSDIYSLGLVAFNMFTGQLPFPAKTSKEAMIARLTERPRTLSEMKADIAWPAGLQAVLDRALARDAEDRYFSAREFGRDVIGSLASMPNIPVDALGTAALESRELERIMRSGGKATPGVRPAALANTMAAAPSPLGASGMMPPMRGATIAHPPSAEGPAAYVPTGTTGAQPPRRSNRSAFAAGIGVAVVLLAGGAWYFSHSGPPAQAADSVAVVAQAPSAAVPSVPVPGDTIAPAAPTVEPAPSAPAAGAPAPRTDARPTATPPRVAEPRVTTPPQPARTAAQPNVAVVQPLAPAPNTAAPTVPAPQPERREPDPAPAVPSAPAFDRGAATQEIRGAIARFVAAFETRRIEEVRRVYPGMSVESANRWQALLGERSVSELKTSVARAGTPDFTGDEAEVTFAMALSFKAGGRVQQQEIPYTARVRREGSAWRITSLSGR